MLEIQDLRNEKSCFLEIASLWREERRHQKMIKQGIKADLILHPNSIGCVS